MYYELKAGMLLKYTSVNFTVTTITNIIMNSNHIFCYQYDNIKIIDCINVRSYV